MPRPALPAGVAAAPPRGLITVRSMPGLARWRPSASGDAAETTSLAQQPSRCALLERYDFGRVNTLLGRGSFGQVLGARDRASGARVAVKVLGADAAVPLGKVLAECSIMFELAAHPCIVKLLAAFQLQPAGTFALVMELLPGGELYTRVAARGYLPEPEARTILAQILDALRYMHARRIAHRDLKLENILIAGGDGANIRIKLVDFGLSRRLAPSPGARTGWTAAQAATAAGAALRAPASPQHSASDSLAVLGAPRRTQGAACNGASPTAMLQQMRRRGGGAKPPTDRRAAAGTAAALAAGAQLEAAAAECRGVPRFHTTVGSAFYMAPEVTRVRASLLGYGLAADLWSAGVCGFAMLCGAFPFTAATDAELLALLSTSPAVCMDAGVWATVSPQCRDIVARLLQPLAAARPSADAALQHAWFAPPPPLHSQRAALSVIMVGEEATLDSSEQGDDAGLTPGTPPSRCTRHVVRALCTLPMAPLLPSPPASPQEVSGASSPQARTATTSGTDAARALLRAVRARLSGTGCLAAVSLYDDVKQEYAA